DDTCACCVSMGKKDRELIAADPRRDIRVPQVELEDLGHASQSAIACRVTALIVEALHSVEVEREHRDRTLIPGSVSQRPIEVRAETTPICEAGELIAMREVAKPRVLVLEVLDPVLQ